MTIATDLQGFFFDRSARATIDDLTSGRITATEVVTKTLDAIDRINPQLNAFSFVDHQGALLRAAELDKLHQDGSTAGPLHGIPIGIKEIIDVKGLLAERGSGLFAGRIAEHDAPIVTRLRDAGAIIVGMTVTHEFAHGGTADISVHGPVHNPHNLTHISGGSSGGSGAAVGAGLVPFALGTDTGGSIRLPAAFCGHVGFKPQYGVLPVDDIFPLASSLDTVGPMARTLEDCELLYGVLDPAYNAANTGAESTISLLQPSGDFTCDPRIWKMVHERVADLYGTDIDRREIPDIDENKAAMLTIFHFEAHRVHAPYLPGDADKYQTETAERLTAAGSIIDSDYQAALLKKAELTSRWLGTVQDREILVLPTTVFVAPEIGERTTTVESESLATLEAIPRLTRTWNLIGVPTIAVPIGELDGLPVSAQLVGHADRVADLFRAAQRFCA